MTNKITADFNMDDIVIGLDLSTTACKAIAVDHQGRVVARSAKVIPLAQPQPGYYEQNAADWWHSAASSLQEISRQINPERIKALAISNQRETFVALDKNNTPLRPAIIWLDERCKDEVEPFARLVGPEKLHHITGKPVDYAPVVYRLAWMKKHEPNLYSNIAMICDVHSWLVWKLTGTFKTSRASADPLGLFDMKKEQWSAEILSALDLSEEQLPQTFAPGTVLATLSDKAARTTGLHRQTLVVAGGGDGQAAGLGTNALDPQTAYLNLGTAVVAGIYNSEYQTNPAYRTMYSCSESGYYYECSLRAGTFAIDWFIRNILAIDPQQQPQIYTVLEKEAQATAAGSDGLMFLPYINGAMNPYWNANARGAFSGMSSSHRRGHMYRAILEGIAFEQKLALESVERTTAKQVKTLLTIGGGAQSTFWCGILADICGKDIALPAQKEASGLGAAIAAAVAAGWQPSFKAAAGQMTSIEKTIKPDKQKHEAYQSFFEAYKKLYPALYL